jgi:hypothetical protein
MSVETDNNNAASQPEHTQPAVVRGFAHVISFLFHPIFMPVVMSLVIYKLAPAGFAGMTVKQIGLLMISITVSTVIFPMFSILLMKPLGFISSYQMPTARERTIPLMATMIFYFWMSHVLNSMAGNVPTQLKVLMMGNFWGIILVFLANIFTRVSMHTAAAGGMIGILIVLMFDNSADMTLPLFVAIIIAGIIGSARLILGAHQKGDVWLGYLIGVIVQLGAYLYINI